MAMVNCGECGRDISDKAAACVGCGAPVVGATAMHNPPSSHVVKTAKSRGVYIILGLFFGTLGLHNFYAGYNGRAVVQLLITIVLGWVVIGLVITLLWALAELIAVDRDAAGDLMV